MGASIAEMKEFKTILFSKYKYILRYRIVPKISTPYQHYDEFGQKYEDLDQHYMQKSGAYFRDYTVINILLYLLIILIIFII